MSFNRRHFSGFRGAIFCASALFAFTSGRSALAAEPGNSAPKLISTTGGKKGRPLVNCRRAEKSG